MAQRKPDRAYSVDCKEERALIERAYTKPSASANFTPRRVLNLALKAIT